MSDLMDLQKYKKAKLLISDLEKLIYIFEDSIEKLRVFNNFVPVKESLFSLRENKQILKFHLEKQKEILEKKGKI